MEFLSVPDSYYDTLKERGLKYEDISELKKYGILCILKAKLFTSAFHKTDW